MMQILIGGNMRTTGEIIKEKRMLKGYTATKLAEEIGVSQSFVTAVENNRKSPSVEVLKKLTTLIHLDEKDLKQIEEYEKFRKLPEETREKLMQLEKIKQDKFGGYIPKTEARKIKVFGMVSAGRGVVDGHEVEEREIIVPNGLKIHENDFCVRVHGDSMEDALYDGDLILVDTTLCGDWAVYNRKIVVISLNGERFVKKLEIKNYKPIFTSLNEAYPPITLEEHDDLQCVGIVTALLFRDYSKSKF